MSQKRFRAYHYDAVIMDAIASQITSLAIVFSTVYLVTHQRKHQSSASLAFVRGIHRRPVNSPHKWPVTRKMFPFDDVIMYAPINWVIIVSSNGLLPTRCIAITLVDADTLSYGLSGTYFSKTWLKCLNNLSKQCIWGLFRRNIIVLIKQI